MLLRCARARSARRRIVPAACKAGSATAKTIVFRVAFKPTGDHRARTTNRHRGERNTRLAARGRHDPCVLPRAVPIVEAMAALVLCDHALRQKRNRPITLIS